MFKKISIENFRGIGKLELDDFQQINLFVGKNNCGKSTILESLFLAIAPMNASLPVNVNLLRGLQEINENSWLTLFHKMSSNSEIIISTQLDTNDKRKLVVTPNLKSVVDVARDKSKIRDNSIKVGSDVFGSSSLAPSINGLQLDLYVTEGGNKKSKKFHSQVTSTGAGVEATLSKDYKESLNGAYLTPQTMFLDMLKRLDGVIVKKQLLPIIEILQEIDASLVNLSLGADVIYCDVGLDRLMPINVMGDGMRRLLAIILTISAQKNGFILIDEIDTGLHYSVQEVLWNVIFKSAKKFNVQIFASTHSIECVKAFSSAYSNQSSKDVAIKLYRIEKRGDDIKAIDYDDEILAASLESGWEIR